MSISTTSDAKIVCFGPLDEVLETQNSLRDETSLGSVGDALAPVMEVLIRMDLVHLVYVPHSEVTV